MSIGGDLPTEAEWEYAARGSELRAYSWGNEPLDPKKTNAWGGESAKVWAVQTSTQDKTPDGALYDLMGNVQEWTSNVYQGDLPDGQSWSDTSAVWYAVRGLPLAKNPPAIPALEGSAWRDRLCGTGPDCEETWKKGKRFSMTGFRCVKSKESE
jgi:formylglycine-generating enzyme required for sulfatase activity